VAPTADHRRVAIVTGAAQGVGEATARRLAADGFTVAINDLIDDGRLSSLADDLGGITVPADIAEPEAGAVVVERTRALLGEVDLLVANAADMAMGPFLEQPPERWWRQIDVNLSGHFRLIQAVVPSMRRVGGGRIVIVASGWGVTGYPNATAYAASKAGLIALTKGLGLELSPEGIITNAIAPSYVDTPQLQVDADDAGISLDEMRRRYRQQIPIGRLASVQEIAASIAFLASPLAGAFVGQVLQPCGGVVRTRA
jgi:2-hydroxycyclohexanecarboxyl-CoA dehydrogenase